MKVLLLAGTGEAVALAARLARVPGVTTIASFAGRTTHPKLPPDVETRVGGFGGVAGLRSYLHDNKIHLVIDAVHPYAKQMHHHAAAACASLSLPILGLTRASWTPASNDTWYEVSDFEAAAARARALGRRIFLSIGRQELAAFAACDDRWFLIRSIDPPQVALPPDHHLLLVRGPFAVEDELSLLREHTVDLIVSKNSGGEATFAKVRAARTMGIPIVMVRRPDLPVIPRSENLDDCMIAFHAFRKQLSDRLLSPGT